MREIIRTTEHKIGDRVILQLNKYYSGSDICEEANLLYREGQVVHLDDIIVDTSSDYEVVKFHIWDNRYVYTCYYDEYNRIVVDKTFDIVSRKHINIFGDDEYKLIMKE